MSYRPTIEHLSDCTVHVVDEFGNTTEEKDLTQFHVAELHLIPLDGGEDDKVKCSFERENGKLVLKCRKPN